MTRFLQLAAPVGLLLYPAIASPAAARQAQQAQTATQIQRLLACRSIASAAARVQCFDREALNVEQALQSKQLVVVDRATASAARRSLFGFGVPNIGNLFGGADDQVKEIQSVVARASYRGLVNGWTITLADGSVWAQTDDTPVALAPRKGDKIRVRRGSLGSYYLTIVGQPGFKVRRIG